MKTIKLKSCNRLTLALLEALLVQTPSGAFVFEVTAAYMQRQTSFDYANG